MPRVYWMRTFSVMQKMKKKQTRLFGALLSRAAAPSFGLVEIKKGRPVQHSAVQCRVGRPRVEFCVRLLIFFFWLLPFLAIHRTRYDEQVDTHMHTRQRS